MNVERNAKSKLSFTTSLVALLAVTGVLVGAVSADPAGAKQIRLFSGAFGAAGSTPSNPYPLSSGWFGPSSVAVDNATGDLYVTDQGNHRIEKFTANGEFILMFGKEVNRTKVTEAAPEAQQDACTAASGDTCQAGARASSPGGFNPANLMFQQERAYLFVAVDNSSGPSKGDVYVADSSDDLVTKFDSSGNVIESWGNNGSGGAADGQLNGSGATGPIQGFYPTFEGIATDSSGHLWVADGGPEFNSQGAVAEFSQDSSFVRDWGAASSFDGIYFGDWRAGLALDSLDNVYALPNKYDETGHWFGEILGPGVGVAVDPSSGELYTASGGDIQRFDSSCKPVEDIALCQPAESFGAGHFSTEMSEQDQGLAINPNTADTVYAAELRGEVAAFSIETVPDVLTAASSGFTASSAVLNGAVNPDGVPLSECFFEWGQTSEPYEHTAQCEPSAAAVGSGASSVSIHANISALQSGKTYHFRIVAANAHDVNGLIDEPSIGADRTFGAPLLESSGAAAVSSTAATLHAEADPNGVDTRARFEYGAEAGVYDHVTSVVDLGSGGAFQGVSQPIQGLGALTAYHYRVVLENIFGTVEGEDHSFTTQGPAAPGLPDGRVWELVSPPDKNGVPLEAITEEGGDIQAAADGSGLAYIAKGAIDAEPAGNRSPSETQLLARRGPGGWSTQDVAAQQQAPAGVVAGKLSEYLLFSSNLSRGALQPFGSTSLSPEASEYTPYLRESDGYFTPLVYPGNVPVGAKFGGEVNAEIISGGVTFLTGTPDLSHLILTSSSVLTTPSFASHGTHSIYEWENGALGLVSLVPAAPAVVCGGSGPVCFPAAANGLASEVGNNDTQMRHAVSADGDRIIFTAGNGLFLRDMARSETVELDARQQGAAGGPGSPIFQDASVDGSRVFFTDSSKLTVDSTATEAKPDLYLCDIGEQAGRLSCALSDISVDHNSGEAADVLGNLIGSDETGRHVYFVADGVLAPGATSGSCDEALLREKSDQSLCNLYVYDTESGKTALVASISGRDSGDWSGGVGANLGGLTAAVSASGRFLAFMSERSLTGYDNRDARDGQPDEEVYLYDALADGGHGKLVCASCNPTGARPAGVSDSGGFPGMLVDRPTIWQGAQLAASIPGWTKIRVASAIYQSRYLSDSGRLFFNAADALVPQDSNGTEDVYQYEPPGVGGCSESSATFGNASGGCVELISSGTSVEESAFLDASESGNDVFFLTAAKLASADVDSAIDVYDAHVCGSESSCPSSPPSPPPACEGDACQSPVPAPEDPTPDSLTFQGPGNLTFAAPPIATPKAKPPTRAQKLARALRACRRKQAHKRPACERQARRSYGQPQSKKSNRRGK